MILFSILAATILISFSKSSPLSYITYQRTDGLNGDDINGIYKLPYLIDMPRSSINSDYWPYTSEDDVLKINTSANNDDRVKKIHSLSVSNSLDVLRQRVLLELARRKQLQDQQQINANRRILDNIGKRTGPQWKTIRLGKSQKQNSYWDDKNNVSDEYDDNNELQETSMNKMNLL